MGRLGFRGAWQCLGVRRIPAIALVVLLNAPGFGLHSAAEAQSKEPETKVEGNVCTAAGAAVAEALVSLVNGAEEKVAETQTDGDGKFVITVARPVLHPGSTGCWKRGRMDSARSEWNWLGWVKERAGTAK